MKEQLMLLSVLLVALSALANTSRGNGIAFAYALPDIIVRNRTADLYERTVLWFEKAAEELQKEFKEGFEKYKGEIKTLVDDLKGAVEKKASAEDLKTKGDELDKKIKEVQDLADELQTKANRLKTDQDQAQGKSFGQQFEKGLTDLQEKTKGQGGLKSLPKRDGQEIEIDLKAMKAVSNMTTGYSLPASTSVNLLRGLEMESGVAKDPTTPLFVRDLITVGSIDKHTIEWVEMILREGGAAQVAEAGLFPQTSFRFDVKTATSKKTATFVKITEEMLEDVPFIMSEVNDEIVNGPLSILVQLENQLLTGDGNGENHKGLFTQAPVFALPAGFQKLANPNMYDAATAAVLQAVKANYTPKYMLVNPSTLVNMKLTKDANGNYVIAPFVTESGLSLSNVRVIANNRIAEDNYLIGDFSLAKLYIRRNLTIKMFDQNENDPLTDMRTITGSLRGIFRIKTPDLKSFVKGTFTSTIAAIKTV